MYWYSVGNQDEWRYKLQGPVVHHLSDVACDAAEDFHSNHDGWEAIWPLDFTIYESEEGPPVARFTVERETVPQFYAWDRPLEVKP